MKTLVKITLVSLLLISPLYFTSCNPQKKIAGNYTYKTECMGQEGDGSQTVKAYGNGRNYFDACTQAKKNAVNDVLFKGIIDGRPGCDMKPVVPEVNAREKYEDYFNKFFADGGEFLNFVNLKDERIWKKLSRDRKGGTGSVSHSYIIRVLRPELKAKMKADGILK